MTKLGICRACATAQYPPREICVRCLSDAIELQEREVTGTIVSIARIHRSLDASAAEGPVTIASVKLDAGPVAISFVAPALEIGARVHLSVTKKGDSELLAALPLRLPGR